MTTTDTHKPKKPVGRPRKGLSESNLKQSKLVLGEATEDDLEAELSDIERMDLTNLDAIHGISGKYRFIKMKYGNRVAEEFRMRVLYSFVLKRFPNNVIASAFNISLVQVWRLKKQLATHICKQVSRISFNEHLGESLIFKDQMRALALKEHDQVAKADELELQRMKMRQALRQEAQYHDAAKWNLMKLAIGDAKKYEPDYEGYKALDDANEMKAILDAIVSGDEDLIKELTTGKGATGEVSDDFVIE